MRKTLLIIGLSASMLMCTHSSNDNPFFSEFNTPDRAVPFSQIKTEHYMPAIDRSIEIARQEVDDIANNTDAPTFDNTIVALERSGADLDRVLNVFFNLLEADANDEMMEISLEASKKLSDYSTDIVLNQKLWERVKAVYDELNGSPYLTNEQQTVLQKTYDSFANSGANLEGAARDEYKQLSSELSELTTMFGQNVLREMSTYEIRLTDDDLSGLPESLVTAAAEDAKAKGYEGEYLFTLAQPTYMAFMKFSDRADLREKMYKLYNSRNTEGQYSNKENIVKIADIRHRIANLLGSDTYAQQSLKNTMAQTPEAVYNLLDQLAEAYTPAWKDEEKELIAFAKSINPDFTTLNPWDYSYYSNKLKAAKYSFDEEALRPYFELNNVIDGVFGLATKLYGITFTVANDLDVYHPDVKVYRVNDANGDYLGLLYTDFFPRESKRPGAWMTEFRQQDGPNRPHISIVMNFNKPTADTPALLTPYEVETFLHEFGHALHGLNSKTNYQSVAGTSVYRDFVELPSQFNENYLTEKEFLDSFAKHYKTGEAIPQEMINRLVASSRYGAAYACLRQLGFGYLDMAWHTSKDAVEDPVQFEIDALAKVSMFPTIPGTMMSTQFNHIFSGGYAAGYYSYKWAEVLDADAFAKFKENGIFDKATAQSFLTNVLQRGGTENPAVLYRRFRGQDPTIDALLERDGLKRKPVPVPAKD